MSSKINGTARIWYVFKPSKTILTPFQGASVLQCAVQSKTLFRLDRISALIKAKLPHGQSGSLHHGEIQL